MWNVISKTKQTAQQNDAIDMEKLASYYREKLSVVQRTVAIDSAQMKLIVNIINCIIVPAQITLSQYTKSNIILKN